MLGEASVLAAGHLYANTLVKYAVAQPDLSLRQGAVDMNGLFQRGALFEVHPYIIFFGSTEIAWWTTKYSPFCPMRKYCASCC